MKEAINRLGFGAWQLGNTEDWGPMQEGEAISLVQEAYKNGINFFDTAPNYAQGRSETYLGKAVKDFREHIFINSKFGHSSEGESDFSVAAIEPSVRGSLKRLQTTYLDSLLLHNPSMDILQGKTGHFQELERLKKLGLIRKYGVSIDTKEEVEAVLEHAHVEVIELLYNVFFQSCRSLLPKIHQRGIILVIKVPLDSGWLSGKYNSQSVFTGIRDRWSREVIERRGKLVSRLIEMTEDKDLAKYAMGFLWSYFEVTVIIPGIKNNEQLRENVSANQFAFPPSLKANFERLYDEQIDERPIPW